MCEPTIFHRFPFRVVAPSPHSTINIHSLIPFYLPSTGTADRRRNASGSTTQCLACRKLAAGKRLGLRPFRAAAGGSSSSAPVRCSVDNFWIFGAQKIWCATLLDRLVKLRLQLFSCEQFLQKSYARDNILMCKILIRNLWQEITSINYTEKLFTKIL